MKKYESNKARKLLLASMLIPMAISTIPIENIYASEIPNLKVYELNGSPKLEWATEILESNVLENVILDENNLSLNLANIKNNNVSIIENQNEKNLFISRTLGGLGNSVWFPATQSDLSEVFSKKNFYFPEKTKLSMSMKVKSKNNSVITPATRGGLVDNPLNIAPISQPIKAWQDYFYTNSPHSFAKNQWIVASHVKDKLYTNWVMIQDIDYSTGKITLSPGHYFVDDFNVGDYIKQHDSYYQPFESRKVNNDGWETLNFNTELNHNNYSFMEKGISFSINFLVEEGLYIKDIKFGHATEVEVFRDGKSIYLGYLSDFHDKEMRDTATPNKVKVINSSLNNNHLTFSWVKPSDNGITSNYTIQSIDKAGSRSEMSLPQTITLTSDAKKYKYLVSKNQTDNPTIETTANEFNLALKDLNLANDYLHIQAIDASGNVSEVSHFKVSDLVTDDTLQDIYDRLDELENSKDYDDFQDFINDIEDMFGGNLPQDIIDRIEDLGKYHGLNTSFLHLEQGEFTLQTKSINDFGQVKLTSKMQTVTTGFVGEFGVIDARGTQDGWKVNVTASPFTEDIYDGFVGTPNQLPLGSLALKSPNNIERVGKVHKQDDLPTSQINESIIDNGAITVLNANKGEGLGQFKFNFDNDALVLRVDAKTAKIDNKNYPNGITPYSSTITWDLITGP